MTNYHNKYLKYKNKYLELKESIGGANVSEKQDNYTITLNPSGTIINSISIGFLQIRNLETNQLSGVRARLNNNVILEQNFVYENPQFNLTQITFDELPSLLIEYKGNNNNNIGGFGFSYEIIINNNLKLFRIYVYKDDIRFKTILIRANIHNDFTTPYLVGFNIGNELPILIESNDNTINGTIKKINEDRHHTINIELPNYNYGGQSIVIDPNVVNNVKLLSIIEKTEFNFQDEYDKFKDKLNRMNPDVCPNNILKKQLIISFYNNFIVDNIELVINHKNTNGSYIFKKIFDDFLNRIVLNKLIQTNVCTNPIIKSEILDNTIKKIPTTFKENIEIKNGQGQYIPINDISYLLPKKNQEDPKDLKVTETATVIFDTGNALYCFIYRKIVEALQLPVYKTFLVSGKGGSTGNLTSREYVNINMRFRQGVFDFDTEKEFNFKAYIVDDGIRYILLGQRSNSLFKFFEDQYCITHDSLKNKYNDELYEAKRLYTNASDCLINLLGTLNEYKNSINPINDYTSYLIDHDIDFFDKIWNDFYSNCTLLIINTINRFDGIDDINIILIFTKFNEIIDMLTDENIQLLAGAFFKSMAIGMNKKNKKYNKEEIVKAYQPLFRIQIVAKRIIE